MPRHIIIHLVLPFLAVRADLFTLRLTCKSIEHAAAKHILAFDVVLHSQNALWSFHNFMFRDPARFQHLTGHLTLAIGHVWDRTPLLDVVHRARFLTSLEVRDVDTTVCSMSDAPAKPPLWPDEPTLFSEWPDTPFLRRCVLDYARIEPRGRAEQEQPDRAWMSDWKLAAVARGGVPSVKEVTLRLHDRPFPMVMVRRVFPCVREVKVDRVAGDDRDPGAPDEGQFTISFTNDGLVGVVDMTGKPILSMPIDMASDWWQGPTIAAVLNQICASGGAWQSLEDSVASFMHNGVVSKSRYQRRLLGRQAN